MNNLIKTTKLNQKSKRSQRGYIKGALLFGPVLIFGLLLMMNAVHSQNQEITQQELAQIKEPAASLPLNEQVFIDESSQIIKDFRFRSQNPHIKKKFDGLLTSLENGSTPLSKEGSEILLKVVKLEREEFLRRGYDLKHSTAFYKFEKFNKLEEALAESLK